MLRRRTFIRGEVVAHEGIKDLTWLRPDGAEMSQEDWDYADARALGMLVHGEATDETDDRGRPIRGDTMLLLVNASDDTVEFALPTLDSDEWTVLVDTAEEEVAVVELPALPVLPYSLVLLRQGRERRVA